MSATASSDGATCQIGGTPTAVATRATYTVTATNSGGMNTATVVIAVNPLAPSLANAAAQAFDAGVSVTSVGFVNSGGGLLTGCIVGDEFPAGLSLDIDSEGSTCEISGIPAGPAVSPAATHTITAFNATGSNTATVDIAITVDEDLPLLQPPELPIIYPLDEEIGLELDNSEAFGITGCEADSPLPEGITVEEYSNGKFCLISGTVTEESALTGYTITATNDAGSTKVRVYLGFSDGFEISGDKGLVGDNTVVITTENATPSVPNTSVKGDAEGASPKMRYTVDDDDGEITVTVTDHNSQGVFTTLFEDDPNSTQTMDLRAFAEKGELVFEIMSEDWKKYGESGVTDGFSYRVDHSIPGGMTSCDCDIDLDVSDKATGTWIPVFQPISTWLDSARMENMLLNLQYVKTGIVLFPKLETQTSNNGADGDVEFKLRNIRWEIRKLPNLQGFSEGNNTMLRAEIPARLVFDNIGGGFLTGCTVNTPFPRGLTLAVSADKSTCVITGAPASDSTTNIGEISSSSHLVTATNSAGSGLPYGFPLSVCPMQGCP